LSWVGQNILKCNNCSCLNLELRLDNGNCYLYKYLEILNKAFKRANISPVLIAKPINILYIEQNTINRTQFSFEYINYRAVVMSNSWYFRKS
jgi:hypothetical protein